MKRSVISILTATAVILLPACNATGTRPEYGLTLSLGYQGFSVTAGYHPPAKAAEPLPVWESGKAPVSVLP